MKKYCNEVLYKDLTAEDIKKYLEKFMFVELPKNVTSEKTMKPWFDEMKGFVEKGTPLGGYSMDLSKDTTPIKDLFPKP